MSDLNSQARQLFYQSLDCLPGERSAFLYQVCGENAELRRLTEALLEAHESPAAFLELPIVERAQINTHQNDTDGTTRQTRLMGKGELSGEPVALGDSRYRAIRSHAQGGLGEVYVAEDRELKREVALKEIRREFAQDRNIAERFMLEAHVTGRLEHPGIVPVYGAGRHPDGRPFYAMRFIRGESLDKAIQSFHGQPQADRAERSVAFRQLLGRFVDVCQAAAYAHSKNVIHRDLKPSNVMLGRFGETLLVDWGLARVVGQHDLAIDLPDSRLDPTFVPATATRAGFVLGTPAYMSPEQAAGDLDRLGPTSDIYSLGAMLYEILTGKPPFDGSLVDVLVRIQHGHFPRPREIKSHVPAALEAVCLKAMALAPGDRYADAQQLAGEVESWLADEPPAAWREPLRARAARWVRKHQRLTAVSLTLGFVALIISAAAAMWYQNERGLQQARQAELARETTVELNRAELALDSLSTSLADQRQVQNFVSDLDGWRRGVETIRTALDRGELVAGDGAVPLDPAVGERMETLRGRFLAEEQHLKLAERLDRIRLDAVQLDAQDLGYMHMEKAGEQYAKIFKEVVNVDVERDDPTEIAKSIRLSPYQTLLVAALDHWAISSQVRQSRQAHLLPKILEIARKADPDPWRDRFRQINAWQGTERLNTTASLANEVDVAAQSPHTLEALVFKLRVEDRRPLLKRALLAYPGDFWLNFAAGRVSKEPAARAGYLQAAMAIRPRTVVLYYHLGVALTEYGDLDGAIAAYRKAAEIDPNGAAIAYAKLATIFLEQRHWSLAAENYRLALNAGANQVEIQTNLATCLAQLGRNEEAINEYRVALKTKPDHPTALAGLGQVLIRVGRYAEAAQATETALRFTPLGHPNRPAALELDADARAHVALTNESPTRITLSNGHVQVSGELQANDPKEASPPNRGSPRSAYVARLEAEKHYQIDAEGDFRKCLRVEDENQFCLSLNEHVTFDNRGHCRLVFSPEDTGDYRIVVAARMPNELGKFTLEVAEVRDVGPPQIVHVNPPANDPNQTTHIRAEATIHLESGTVYRCELSGAPRPHFLAIRSPDGRSIKQAPAIGPRRNGMVFLDLTPQVTGEYSIEVESLANVEDRGYILAIRRFLRATSNLKR